MREEIRGNPGITVFRVLFRVFGSIGLVYILVATAFHFLDSPDPLPMIFGILGTCFAAAALVMLWLEKRKNRRMEELLRNGKVLTCTVTGITVDARIRVNGHFMQVAECAWTDPVSGVVHVFRSRGLTHCPRSVIGQEVKVYVDRNSDHDYYVDMDAILPKMVIH